MREQALEQKYRHAKISLREQLAHACLKSGQKRPTEPDIAELQRLRDFSSIVGTSVESAPFEKCKFCTKFHLQKVLNILSRANLAEFYNLPC